MNKVNLSILKEETDLRSVWEHEALDFTPWLAQDENINLLGEAVGLEITVDETESSVGDFSVDILATETNTGRKIIIENQLEDTNHDHLGKLITYAAGKEAEIIIWVVKRARDEHRAAVEWLNSHTDDKICFFLCEIKLYRIGSSDPAVKFEVIEKPNDWARATRKVSSETPELVQKRINYWQAYLDYARQDDDYWKEFKFSSASGNHWLTQYIHSSTCQIIVNQIRKYNHVVVEIWIGDDKDFFAKLYEHKAEIENIARMELDWNELPDKKASRILAIRNADLDDRNDWQAQFEWIKDIAVKLKTAVKPYL